MEMILIGLVVLAIILFIFSFFQKDRVSDLEKNVEDLSLQHIQDVYLLKKKIAVLEEELLIQESDYLANPSPSANRPVESKRQVHEILQNQVLSLYQQGLSLEEIQIRSTLSQDEITTIIQNSQLRGL